MATDIITFVPFYSTLPPCHAPAPRPVTAICPRSCAGVGGLVWVFGGRGGRVLSKWVSFC
ncbi:hypothetical protein E2C01_071473 [Portunus trituberculatus]|uniref:Uncharacterized protein n=1 Tax=Portunus trituberculatus TaxID=210409 RepID=A0A5B7I8B2_PORTR|nr:hypothetical protein [Portunus trituberculatus]